MSDLLRSENVDALAVALAKFHSECPKIVKDTKNDFYKSKYADLGTILGIVNPVLAKNDLSVIQLPVGENKLTTMLVHKSGQFIGSTSIMRPAETVVRKGATPAEDVRSVTPQALGSAITYQRRYAVAAILSLCIDEDDDGNAGSGTNRESDPGQEPKPQSKPQSKPEAKPVAKKTDAEIASIQNMICTATLEQLPKLEAALNNSIANLSIDRATAGSMLACLLVDRWIAVSAVSDIGAIGTKIVGLRSKGIITEDQQKMLTEEINKKLAEAKK